MSRKNHKIELDPMDAQYLVGLSGLDQAADGSTDALEMLQELRDYIIARGLAERLDFDLRLKVEGALARWQRRAKVPGARQ